jgi:hypothetical protein
MLNHPSNRPWKSEKRFTGLPQRMSRTGTPLNAMARTAKLVVIARPLQKAALLSRCSAECGNGDTVSQISRVV